MWRAFFIQPKRLQYGTAVLLRDVGAIITKGAVDKKKCAMCFLLMIYLKISGIIKTIKIEIESIFVERNGYDEIIRQSHISFSRKYI